MIKIFCIVMLILFMVLSAFVIAMLGALTIQMIIDIIKIYLDKENWGVNYGNYRQRIWTDN